MAVTLLGLLGLCFGSSGASAFRILRVGRLLFALSYMKYMQILAQSLAASLPAIGNMFLLLLLILFMFGVVGVQLFGGIAVEANPFLHPTLNFHNLWNAFPLLLCASLTEHWVNFTMGCYYSFEGCEGCGMRGDGCGGARCSDFFVQKC